MKQRLLRTLCAWTLALTMLCPMVAMEAAAESTVPYIQRMVQYYRHYGEDAKSQIAALLEHIRAIDPAQGALWEAIMADWSWCNSQMPISYGVLPDGLPQDDSLCIVVLGYALNADGSMQPELIARLETALESARKYPNAYIAVTGGGTAAAADITEAEAMASWLQGKGISRDRLILETRSLSTTYNAVNTYALLTRGYPQVRSVAVISSDYHVPWGCAMFRTVSNYTQAMGGNEIELVGNAACATGSWTDTMYYQAKGISVITGIPLASGLPEL